MRREKAASTATAPALVPFAMPSLGADMDAGTVVEWKVAPGDVVHRGDIVAEVETDKSNLDVEVWCDGTVAELVVPVGEKVPIGTVLALLVPLEAGAVAPAPPSPGAPAPAVPAPARAPSPPPAPAPVPDAHVEPASHLTSPLIRRLAEAAHVDVEHLHGSGPGGRVTRDDVERAIPAPAAARRHRATPRARRLARSEGVDLAALAARDDRRAVTGTDVLAASATAAPSRSGGRGTDSMRSAIARQMVRSWQEIPHYSVGARVDVHDALAQLADINAQRPAAQRILPAAVLLHAAARAAAAVPGVNGWWRDDAFVPGDSVHVGVVVALRTGGLLVPVIHDAASQDLGALMSELRDLVTRARVGTLRAGEVSGATFTVTEIGEGGVDSVTPIIHPPQVAILGLGAIHDEPWAENGMLTVRPVVHATLTGDHRAIDGRLGSSYLTTFAAILKEPLQP